MLLDISKTLYCLSRILNLFLLVYTNVQTVDYCWSTSFFLKAPAAAAAAKSHQLCLTLCNPTDGSPPGSPCPWDSPGKNTGAGCISFLPCMRVKSESEIPQSCLTLSDFMDCSLPGSSVHGIIQARHIVSEIQSNLLHFSPYRPVPSSPATVKSRKEHPSWLSTDGWAEVWKDCTCTRACLICF